MELSQSVPLEGTASRDALFSACRLLASALAEKMAGENIVWQEISVDIQTETGTANGTARLAGCRRPDALYVNLENLISRLKLPAPVETLTVTVRGLAPARAEQLRLFDSRPDRRPGLTRAVEETDRLYPRSLVRASGMEVERRERMLAFYDPLRQGGGAPCPGASG